jgi:hypothetical protein
MLFDAIDKSEKCGFLTGHPAEREENLEYPRHG